MADREDPIEEAAKNRILDLRQAHGCFVSIPCVECSAKLYKQGFDDGKRAGAEEAERLSEEFKARKAEAETLRRENAKLRRALEGSEEAAGFMEWLADRMDRHNDPGGIADLFMQEVAGLRNRAKHLRAALDPSTTGTR